MIPASYRLSSIAFGQKKWFFPSVDSPYFSLKWRVNGLSHFRCAVVTPAALSKKAVDRNRIRRFFYDAVCRSVPAPTPLDLVFYVKKAALRDVLSEVDNKIHSSLATLLKK